MIFYNICWVLLIINFLSIDASNKTASKNNIVFDLPDLTIDYDTDDGTINLEAFKSSLNDKIIESNDNEKYGQLTWLSIGNPRLIKFTNGKLFKFNKEGFFINVEMLTNRERELLANVAERKYNIDVSKEQIISLVPSHLNCRTMFYNNYKKIILRGNAFNLNEMPVKVFFSLPTMLKEREIFESKLSGLKNFDLNFDCEIISSGKTYKKNILIITGEQINQLGLIDDIFGPSDSVFVTRNQMNSLMSELYVKLNIIEEYEIPEHEFSSNFLDDLINQTSLYVFKEIPFEEALESMSPYNFMKDLKPNIIKYELQKVFQIEKKGSNENLITNRTRYEHEKKNSETDITVTTGVDIFEVGIGIERSTNYVDKKSRDWAESGTAFNEQLRELNTLDQNNIEWVRKGEIIEPKSIKVSRLSKAAFKKNLIFQRLRREIYDAPFRRTFSLNTKNQIYTTKELNKNSDYIYKLEKEYNALKKEINELKSKIISSVDDLSKELNTITEDTQKISTAIESTKPSVNKRIKSCRVCFIETENGNGKCQGARDTCTVFTGRNINSWTAPFRHDSGLKHNHQWNVNGGCNKQWSLQCNY